MGRALARGLVENRWNVVIDGRDAGALTRLAVELGPALRVVPGDVRRDDHRRALVQAAVSLGELDLVVNNASELGPSPLPALRELDPEVLVDLHRINVVAPLALIQLALPLLERRSGAVVNVTSDAAVEAYEGWGAYGSSKAALEQLSHVLAAEHPALRVWWLDPGDMRTAMHQAAFPGEDISDRPLPESVVPAVLALVTSRPPSGRVHVGDLSATGAS